MPQRSSFVMAPRARTLTTSKPHKSDTVPPGYSVDPSVGPMLRFERSLPHLPVPTLSSTAAKYLETVQPLISPTAYERTKQAVDEFVTSDQGKELQRRLEARAAEPGRASWLSDWWNEAAYMGYRDPVVVFVSYFYVHLDDRTTKTAARRAANLIKAMLPFRDLTERSVSHVSLQFFLISCVGQPTTRARESPQYTTSHGVVQVVVSSVY